MSGVLAAHALSGVAARWRRSSASIIHRKDDMPEGSGSRRTGGSASNARGTDSQLGDAVRPARRRRQRRRMATAAAGGPTLDNPVVPRCRARLSGDRRIHPAGATRGAALRDGSAAILARAPVDRRRAADRSACREYASDFASALDGGDGVMHGRCALARAARWRRRRHAARGPASAPAPGAATGGAESRSHRRRRARRPPTGRRRRLRGRSSVAVEVASRRRCGRCVDLRPSPIGPLVGVRAAARTAAGRGCRASASRWRPATSR